MAEKNSNTWGKIIAGTAALVMGLSMAGCANSSDNNDKEEKAEPATATAAAETEAAEVTEATETETVTEAETEAVTETTASTENSSAAVTGIPEDLDAQLDSMIASAEAYISEIDSAFGTNSRSSESTDSKTVKTTATTAAATAAPAVSDSSLTNEQQFIFDGVTYDNSTFTSAGITKPAGWTLNTKASSGREYINSAYEDCAIVEGLSKGASFMMHQAMQHGKTTLPPLTLYKGLTWGASASDIKAAFGTPAKESNKDNYGTSMTNLFYSAPDGGLIVYEVSSDWGLIVIECFGK